MDNSKTLPKAFTEEYETIMNALHTECGVSDSYHPDIDKHKKPPLILKTIAI
jgi:hypothetical protein